MTIKDIDRLQDITEKVYVDETVKWYISSIVTATRDPARLLGEKTAAYVKMGASPRATSAFLRTAKATALLNGRTYVVPDDVKQMARSVLRHRIALNYSAIADKVNVEMIVDAIINTLKVP